MSNLPKYKLPCGHLLDPVGVKIPAEEWNKGYITVKEDGDFEPFWIKHRFDTEEERACYNSENFGEVICSECKKIHSPGDLSDWWDYINAVNQNDEDEIDRLREEGVVAQKYGVKQVSARTSVNIRIG